MLQDRYYLIVLHLIPSVVTWLGSPIHHSLFATPYYTTRIDSLDGTLVVLKIRIYVCTFMYDSPSKRYNMGDPLRLGGVFFEKKKLQGPIRVHCMRTRYQRKGKTNSEASFNET